MKDKTLKILIIMMSLICFFTLVIAVYITVDSEYLNRITYKLGLTSYQITKKEDYIIRGWKESFSGEEKDVVFFGDSIVYGGEWNEYFPNLNTCNLGVPGDCVESATYRVNIINQVNPQKVFIMLGVNDISKKNYKKIFSEKYEELIKLILKNDTKIYIQSILPVSKQSGISNDKIIEVNSIISDLAEKYNCEYIDIHSLFCNKKGELKAEYSKDGVHITKSAYEKWAELIQKYIIV